MWVNGELGAADVARISPFDHGLLVGDGVFETMRVYGGVPFAWRRHLDRLVRSASGLGLAVPDRAVLREAADAVLRANGLLEARVRITITGGVSPLGSERGDAPPTVVVAASAVTAVGAFQRSRRRAVGAQRAGRDRRAEDDLVCRERARARVRTGTRRK